MENENLKKLHKIVFKKCQEHKELANDDTIDWYSATKHQAKADAYTDVLYLILDIKEDTINGSN